MADQKIWTCKIGECSESDLLDKHGADWPMRRAVQEAYKSVTGREPQFTFSGWAGELTEGERAVVENRPPRPEPVAQQTEICEDCDGTRLVEGLVPCPKCAAQQTSPQGLRERCKQFQETICDTPREANDPRVWWAAMFFPDRLAAFVQQEIAAAHARELLEARLDENLQTPHYSECTRIIHTGLTPYPPCDCWVGGRRVDIERQLAELDKVKS